MATTITYVCDCCQKNVKGGLQALRDDFSLPNIKELCVDCLKALEKFSQPKLEAVQKEHAQLVRNWIADRRAEVG